MQGIHPSSGTGIQRSSSCALHEHARALACGKSGCSSSTGPLGQHQHTLPPPYIDHAQPMKPPLSLPLPPTPPAADHGPGHRHAPGARPRTAGKASRRGRCARGGGPRAAQPQLALRPSGLRRGLSHGGGLGRAAGWQCRGGGHGGRGDGGGRGWPGAGSVGGERRQPCLFFPLVPGSWQVGFGAAQRGHGEGPRCAPDVVLALVHKCSC